MVFKSFSNKTRFSLFCVRHGTKRNKVILPFVQLNFTWVVDKTECTNYSHIHCIVYLVIGRSSQDSYPFTSFAAATGHANFRALSFIHIINGRDTIGYSFSTGMLKLAEWYNYTGRLCWWWCSHWNHDICGWPITAAFFALIFQQEKAVI